MQELQQAIAAVAQEGRGTKLSVQPLPQPGEGCRERFVVWHSYANGVPISKTEVAITYGSQILAFHPKFRWDDAREQDRINDRIDSQRLKRIREVGVEKAVEEALAAASRPPHRMRELLETIFEADSRYVEHASSKPRRRM